MRFEIAWARNDEGERIQALLAADGITILGADWSEVAGYWLVARIKGEAVACIQVAFAKPIARLEFLSIDRRIVGLSRKRLVARMIRAGSELCQVRGAPLQASIISFDQQQYIDVLVRRGCNVIVEGKMVIGRLAPLKRTR